MKLPYITSNGQGATQAPEDDAPWLRMSEPEAAAYFRNRAQGTNTRKSYDAAVKQYQGFCEAREYAPLPGTPQMVQEFIAHLAKQGLAASTIRVRFAGLRWFYRNAVGRENITNSDAVIDTLNGMIRVRAKAPHQAKALTVNDIRGIVRKLPRDAGKLTAAALRDRALLLVMYCAALRRSEAVSLLRDDVLFEDQGVLLFLRSSKTDQLHSGQWIGIGHGKRALTCPVRSLKAWLEASPGPAFVFAPVTRWDQVNHRPLTGKGVGHIVRRLVGSIGLDWEAYSSHSLRAGVVTDLNGNNVSTSLVQERTRHKSASMIPLYHRPQTNLTNNFTRMAGL